MSNWFTRKKTRNPYDKVYQTPHTDYTDLTAEHVVVLSQVEITQNWCVFDELLRQHGININLPYMKEYIGNNMVRFSQK